jgi:hypothetical protein
LYTYKDRFLLYPSPHQLDLSAFLNIKPGKAEKSSLVGKREKQKGGGMVNLLKKHTGKGSHDPERRAQERFPVLGFRPLGVQFSFLPCGSERPWNVRTISLHCKPALVGLQLSDTSLDEDIEPFHSDKCP